MSVLSAASVSVHLGGAPVLRGVDLEISGGELVALVGPNGAGKSTLLGVLAGDVEPDSGEVTLDGHPVRHLGAAALARRRAVLLQHQGLSFGFRVSEVVRMGRSPWHRTPQAERDDEVVASVMTVADVDALADRVFPTLSGGEQARTSFARVLAQEAPVLLLDEPTAALDIRHQEAVLGVARATARAGSAVVVVLHDLSLAAAYADRVCLLDAGRVAADGTPDDVLTAQRLGAVYEHPISVTRVDGSLVVVPVRARAGAGEKEDACVP
ncbi:heme ABC transporter ATP-binding protein [Nocardioides sp.]|uniref:heme ABC transporter ATP-binding protein n=1 Tax=Nocardioides sp. TaxID=35761 RepID=UPI001A28E764|nr:heme ABC transporter ATP-binding protein [Nocardioides sp.]MBJ7355764.1 heme ABC transporter ATP-binding protein [Nocardioides sp.]